MTELKFSKTAFVNLIEFDFLFTNEFKVIEGNPPSITL